MTVVDFTFPQSGDNDYSENFGTWLGRSNITDYVEEGMTFTVDYGVPEVDISQGKAFISTPQATISANSETRLTLDYCIIKPAETVSLTDSDVNHIYLTPNVGSNDSPSFDAFTNEANADSDALKIGEIDTSADTKDESFNRDPDSSFGSGSFSVALNIPVYDLTSEAGGAEGDVIWITGDDSDPAGFYVHNGNSFNQADIDEINELTDVSGVTALIEDTVGNRPAAGSEGRIFFNTTDNTVEYDNGGSWDVLGQDPANIGAGDLGFDPATQTELDNHEADGDAHHAKTVALDELNDSDFNDINVDLESNRPSAGTSGRFFVARDTGRLYYDNGSSWVSVGVSKHGQLQNISSDDHHTRPTAGDGLDDNSNTFNIDVSDFIGSGLEDAGSETIRVDEDFDFTFTSQLDFNAGLSSSGDVVITDGNHLTVGGAEVDLAYDDGSVDCQVITENRFGAEGSSTTAQSYQTIAGSDLVFNPDDYKDSAGNLYIRVKYHLKHSNNSGTVSARLYRQNAASAVTSTAQSLSLNDSWGTADTGWVDFSGESGNESYQIQLESSDGESVRYNSVTIMFGHPQ